MNELPSVTLQYSGTDSKVTEFAVSREDILIGRSSESDIQLDDSQVSRFHASFRISNDGYWLIDLDSSNGVLLDGKLIPPNRRISIHPDQNFKIGSYTFTFKAELLDQPNITVRQDKVALRYMYDLEELRGSEFSHIKDMVILNNAATAPLPNRTQQRINIFAENTLANTSWHFGSRAVELYFEYLSAAADLINAQDTEMVGVEGCSVGLNLVAQALEIHPEDNIVFCNLEYPANVYPWLSLMKYGAEVKIIPAVDGGLTLDSVQEAIDGSTRVVTVSAVQYFSGHLTDMASIGKFCRDRNILFVVDAIQAIGHVPIDVQKMNIDVLVTGGHKSLMSVPGTGFLYVREDVWKKLNPRLAGSVSVDGWDKYLNYNLIPHESAQRFLLGTPNYIGQQANIASISLINELTREAIDYHTTHLAALALETAVDRGYEPTTTVRNHGPIATFRSKRSNDETSSLLAELEEEKGIVIGKQVDRKGDPHIRMSFHCYNTEEDVQRGFEALEMKG